MDNPVAPQVSVVVPTCARTDMLRRALESIRAQTFEDWDCWIVNDSPADVARVEALIEEMGEDRFRFLANPQCVGPSASRNRGIESSSGAILAFLDDDDRWLPDKLSAHVAEHERAGRPAVVYSQSAHVWEEGLFRPFRISPGDPPEDVVDAIREERFWPGGAPVVTASRACFEAVGAFDTQLPCREDQELMLRLATYFPLRYVAEVTVVVTEHARPRASSGAHSLVEGLERLGPGWGVPEIALRQWARDRALMYELVGLLNAPLLRRLAKLAEYGRLARPAGFGWLRWVLRGLWVKPRAAFRLCGLALGGRIFCWLNRHRPFANRLDAQLLSASAVRAPTLAGPR